MVEEHFGERHEEISLDAFDENSERMHLQLPLSARTMGLAMFGDEMVTRGDCGRVSGHVHCQPHNRYGRACKKSWLVKVRRHGRVHVRYLSERVNLLQFGRSQFIALTLVDFGLEVDVFAFLEEPDDALGAGEFQPDEGSVSDDIVRVVDMGERTTSAK